MQLTHRVTQLTIFVALAMATIVTGEAAAQADEEGGGGGTGNCLSCTTTIDPKTGDQTCDVDRATAGYNTCSCPCQCSGACGQGSVDPARLQHEPWLLQPNGVQVAAFDPAESAPRLVAGYARSTALRDRVYFTESAGFVRYADGTWRAYPLETAESFVIRSCEGQFVARVYRHARTAINSASLLQAALSN